MQLKTLLSATPVREVFGSVDRPVENIAYDSRRVQRHTMFVALRGEKTDGHQFIAHAIDKGASVIVTEREQKDPRVTCLVVENTRTALADFSATFYGNPGRTLKLAAVTGTNGKTTTTFLIKHICENAGLRCGLIGTVRYEIGERILTVGENLPGIQEPTAARNWTKIEERMRYVFALFRKFHNAPEVFSTPGPEVGTAQIETSGHSPG